MELSKMDVTSSTVQTAQTWCRRTCMVCVFTCMFAFACCVYCTCMLQRMYDVSAACTTKGISDDIRTTGGNIQTVQSPYDDDENSTHEHVQTMRFRRAVPEKSSRKRKPKPRKKKSKTKAGHYQSITSQQFIEKKFTPYDDGNLAKTCFFIPEMTGTLCRTKDYVTNNTDKVIRAFEAAPWVKDKNAPFKLEGYGNFTAKYSGVHLIYAQVLFYDNKEAEIISLVQKRKARHGKEEEIQSLTCHQGTNKTGSAMYRSCGITGLYNIVKGDVIYLENVLGDVTLNLKISTTYIGAILLK